MFASLVLGFAFGPSGIIIWLLIGLVAGFIASHLMGGGGYGIIGDIIVGLIGAFIGGLIMSLIIPNATTGFWTSIVVAIIGACILIAILRFFTRGTRRVL
jgi:uncharacterized membrane protein YeaQ/YmgE (transglycosylase-associated protein family)